MIYVKKNDEKASCSNPYVFVIHGQDLEGIKPLTPLCWAQKRCHVGFVIPEQRKMDVEKSSYLENSKIFFSDFAHVYIPRRLGMFTVAHC